MTRPPPRSTQALTLVPYTTLFRSLVDGAGLMLQMRGGYSLKKASALEAVKKSTRPVLIIHGQEDAFVPVEMAYELYDAADCEKEILIVEGAGHAQAPDKAPGVYYNTVFSFLETHGMGVFG